MINRKIHLDKKNGTSQFKKKPEKIQVLINDALFILEDLGISLKGMSNRMKEKIGMNLLALADMKSGKNWSNAKDISKIQMKTRDILNYVNENFGENRSSGSYDDVRRKELKPLTLSGIVENSKPGSSTNDSTRGYGLSLDYSKVIRTYGTGKWKKNLAGIIKKRGKFSAKISPRKVKKIPIKIPNREQVYLSLGKHNVLQKAIIEEMLEIFCPHSELLYLGDTAKKQIVNEEKKLKSLNFFALSHEMLPDVVAYSKKKNWLYLIEAVYTSNPMNKYRKFELKKTARKCKAGIVFVSAFLNMSDFRKYISEIAWETEVWIADDPKHMIHFNGDKFLGPYK